MKRASVNATRIVDTDCVGWASARELDDKKVGHIAWSLSKKCHVAAAAAAILEEDRWSYITVTNAQWNERL